MSCWSWKSRTEPTVPPFSRHASGWTVSITSLTRSCPRWPGSAKGGLGVEDGCLVYAYDIMLPGRPAEEVIVDAGTGKVLVNGVTVDEGDGVAVTQEMKIELTALRDTELVVVELV